MYFIKNIFVSILNFFKCKLKLNNRISLAHPTRYKISITFISIKVVTISYEYNLN